MKEYSEAKTYKNKAELRNSEANTDFFLFISGNNNYCQSHGVRPGICLRETTETREQMFMLMLADIYASSSDY